MNNLTAATTLLIALLEFGHAPNQYFLVSEPIARSSSRKLGAKTRELELTD